MVFQHLTCLPLSGLAAFFLKTPIDFFIFSVFFVTFDLKVPTFFLSFFTKKKKNHLYIFLSLPFNKIHEFFFFNLKLTIRDFITCK